MVASFTSAPARTPVAARGEAAARRGRRSQEHQTLKLLEGSLSAQRIERRSPLLAGLHRLSTGALAGLGLTMLALSGLTLHWQNQWARSYADLEASKVLEQRLQESSALLEQHHLGAVRRPGQLVPTSSEKLIHLSSPSASNVHPALHLLSRLQIQRIPAGY
ncbi:MAG: hypothetical protein VKI83_12680 [Synechococcaceae cyanobacterium]|nr:hypothetical protein [Synechococcaceae cyanobacterium]